MPKLFDPTPKPKEPPCFLRLIEEGADVKLVIVDERGERLSAGYVLKVVSSGELYLNRGISPESARKAGLTLNSSGQIEQTDFG